MSPDQVDDCAEYLSKRCESKSLVVKSKALRAIRTFCVRAPATFRQKMARHSVVVRACASHTGAPHPLKGDAPHKQVRDLADEAVRAIFDGGDAGVSRPSPNANPPGERRTAAGVPIVDDAPIGHDGNPRLRKTTGTWGGEERREGFGLRGAYASSSESSEKKDDQTASGAFAPARNVPAAVLRKTTESPRRADKSSPGDGNTSLRSDTGGGLFRQEGSEEQRRVDAACARGGVKLAPSAEVRPAAESSAPPQQAVAAAHKVTLTGLASKTASHAAASLAADARCGAQMKVLMTSHVKDSLPRMTVAANVESLAHIVARVPAACATTRQARSLDMIGSENCEKNAEESNPNCATQFCNRYFPFE